MQGKPEHLGEMIHHLTERSSKGSWVLREIEGETRAVLEH
jgi:hypothetical protein